MRRVDAGAALALILASGMPAVAATRSQFDVPAGRLADAAIAVGRQGGASIGLDPALAGLPTPALRGTMAVGEALARLLQRLPAKAEAIDGSSWRIVRAARPARAIAAPIRPQHLRPVAARNADIVVTATKRDARLDRYPGTAYVVDAGGAGLGGTAGTETIVARLPTLASTALGPGRNKLFIRGIADSSFNGPSQATVGQYLGDLRLNYNAPDPNLILVDIASVEVLEGPQGTLYGAGALGGIVRLVPEPVRTGEPGAAASAGYALTAHAAASYDVSTMFNLPLITDRLAVRAVAYRAIDGGTIDDAGRGLSNVNRTVTTGGRATLRYASPDGWTVDVQGVLQNIDSADAQYAERGLPPRTRRSSIAQPYDSDYALAGVTVARDFDSGLSVRSASGVVLQDADSTYDFTPAGGAPALFHQRNRIRVLSSENRISRRDIDGAGWVAGFSILHDGERQTRLLGPVASPARILGVANTVTDVSAFAEFAFRLSPRLIATVGGRVDFAHLTGEVLDRDDLEAGEPRRNAVSLLPSLALSWSPHAGVTVFIRYQRGFRPGDLSVSGDAAGPVVQRFRGDSIATAEAGGRIEGDLLDASLTASYSNWVHIQADLVDASGLPFTTNIGNGRVIGLEAQAGWRPWPAVRFGAAAFVNHSRLDDPAAGFETAEGASLPNIARVGARTSVDFTTTLSARLALSGGASVRYVGASRLGAGPGLDFLQGRYVDTAANLRLGMGRFGVTLDATNLLDATGNRFALGNPFDVAAGRQLVPLRPRTVRLGVDARF